MKIAQNENFSIENFEETKFFFEKCHISHIIILALGSHYKHFNLNLEDFPIKFCPRGSPLWVGNHTVL
jgi:hypothetical protein